MATILPCDMCEAEQADIIVTNLGNGDTMAIGAACLPLLGQQFMASGPEPEGLEPIGADGTGWPGDVNLDGLELPSDPAMRKAWEEAGAQALAELEAEAAQNAAQASPEGSAEAEGVTDGHTDAEADSGQPEGQTASL